MVVVEDGELLRGEVWVDLVRVLVGRRKVVEWIRETCILERGWSRYSG